MKRLVILSIAVSALFLMGLSRVLGDDLTETSISSERFYAMNYTEALINDKEGNIFIIYRYPYKSVLRIPRLAKWDGEELHFISKNEDFRYGVARNIVPDNEKGVWIATDEGLIYFHDDESEHFKLPQPENSYRKISRYSRGKTPMIQDKHDNIWALVEKFEKQDVYTSDRYETTLRTDIEDYEIWKFSDGSWKHFENINFNGVYKEPALGKSPEGEFLIAHPKENALTLLQFSNEEVIETANFFRDFAGNQLAFHVSGISSTENQMIISYKPNNHFKHSRYEALSIYEPESGNWTHFGRTDRQEIIGNDYYGIPHPTKRNNKHRVNWANLIVNDPYEGIWIGRQFDYNNNGNRSGGLIYYDGKGNFKHFHPADPSIAEAISFGPGRLYSTGKTLKDLNVHRISGIGFDKKGNLWTGSELEGLFMIRAENLPKRDRLGAVSEQVVEPSERRIGIYPNPVYKGSELNVVLNKSEYPEEAEIMVLTPQGREVYSVQQNLKELPGSLTISTGNFPAGLYILKVNNFSSKPKRFIVIE